MHNFDGIIFDIDGTLTYTNELIFASFRYVYNKYFSKNITNAEISKLFGPTEDVILKEWSGNKYDEVRSDYYNYYSQNHHIAGLYPGIEEILAYIKDKNVPIAIYTGKGRETATITLKKLEIYNYFNLIITGDDVKKHKPSAEGIIKFVSKFDIPKEKTLMIGDSPSDVKAARSAGVKICSVVWDSYATKEVFNMESDYLFHTVEELNDFIQNNI